MGRTASGNPAMVRSASTAAARWSTSIVTARRLRARQAGWLQSTSCPEFSQDRHVRPSAAASNLLHTRLAKNGVPRTNQPKNSCRAQNGGRSSRRALRGAKAAGCRRPSRRRGSPTMRPARRPARPRGREPTDERRYPADPTRSATFDITFGPGASSSRCTQFLPWLKHHDSDKLCSANSKLGVVVVRSRRASRVPAARFAAARHRRGGKKPMAGGGVTRDIRSRRGFGWGAP
jgi:hypothetical protein